jgi:hypothetical protein
MPGASGAVFTYPGYKEIFMQKMNRRNFCGAALLTLPLMKGFAQENTLDDWQESQDPVMDILAGEFARVTLEGARSGFKGEHFRQYAAQMRIFDAHLESLGTNRKLNASLDADDYQPLDPGQTARMMVEFWKMHGILFDENAMTDQMTIDLNSYRAVKRMIKSRGGVRKLHRRIADLFDRKADEFRSGDFRSGLTIYDGSVKFPRFSSGSSCKGTFLNVQDFPGFIPGFDGDIPDSIDDLPENIQWAIANDLNIDCLCKAMKVEGAVLTLLCVSVCQPCCIPAAVMIAIATLLQNLGYCHPERC